MNTIKCFIFAVAAAFAMTACTAPAGNAPANANHANMNANANANMAKTSEAAPTKEALLTTDKSAYEAWKTKNTGFWDGFLAQNFVGYGATGRMDRAAAMKQYAGTNCDVKSYSMSDDQMTPLGTDAAIISYKVAMDATCDGQKLPPEIWAASLYVREGDKWKGAYHAETPVENPNAPPAKAAAPAKPAAAASPASAASPAAGASSDSMTEPMLAIEKKGWEAWKNRDAKAVEEIMSKDFVYFSGNGRKPRAEAVKGWSEPKCEGLGYSFSDPKTVSFTKDVALITYNADVKGTCDGKPVPPHIWVASFDIKEGDAWKNAFYMDSPR